MRLKELLPNDAIEYVNAFDLCHHLSGEITGGGSDRDAEINPLLEKECGANYEKLEKEIELRYPQASEIGQQLSQIEKDIEADDRAYLWNDLGKNSTALQIFYESYTQSINRSLYEFIRAKHQLNVFTGSNNKDSMLDNLDRLNPDTRKRLLENYRELDELRTPSPSMMPTK